MINAVRTVHHFTARTTNGNPINSICLEKFIFLAYSINILGGFISKFSACEKTTVMSTVIERNAHKKKIEFILIQLIKQQSRVGDYKMPAFFLFFT